MGPGTACEVFEIPSPTPGAVVDLGVIELRRGLQITGRVVDASGKGVADARVTIGRLDHFYSYMRAIQLAFRNNFETRTDEAGVYRFAGIGPSEPVSIAAMHPIHGTAPAVPLPTSDATIDLTLLATGAIDGTYVGFSTNRIQVMAERCDQPSDRHYTRAEDGSFVFENIPVGRYRLTVTRSDAVMPVVVELRPGERTTVSLVATLHPRPFP